MNYLRWAVRLTLVLAVAASVSANILHAEHNPISQAIAGWPPLALLLTIELVSRVPLHRRSLAVMRIIATVVISGIAAWVSYWHMVGVASHYGETGSSPYLLPVSVDGLIVVASICLVELATKEEKLVAQDQVPENDVAVSSLPLDDLAPVVPPVEYVKPQSVSNRESDELKAKAITYIQTYTDERTLTGKAIGDLFGKSDRWGRDRLREARQGVDRAVAPAIDSAKHLSEPVTSVNGASAGVAG